MKRTLYVVLEGCDGSGKSTVTSRLMGALVMSALQVRTRCEPTDGPHGKEIRHRAVAGPPLTAPEALDLFVKDRREYFGKTQMLTSGFDVVVQDRSYFSTAVYQGDQPGCPTWQEIVEDHEKWVPIPHLILLLDLPSSVATQRVLARGQALTAFEKDFRRIRSRYLEVLEGRPELAVIDASKPLADVVTLAFEETMRTLTRLHS